MAALAGNLARIRSLEEGCFPKLVVGWIGNPAHQSENSDHNPDSRGLVHAIDLMFGDDVAFHHGAPESLAWLLTPGVRGSLEYVIHDRQIWTRSKNWHPVKYTGVDPHTNHIHVSGMHGTVGQNAATGTGYNVAAEHMVPTGSPCEPVEEDVATIDKISPEAAKAIGQAVVDALVAEKLGSSGPTIGVVLQRQPGQLDDLIASNKTIAANTAPAATP